MTLNNFQKRWVGQMLSGLPEHLKQFALDIFSKTYDRFGHVGHNDAYLNAKFDLSEVCIALQFMDKNCTTCQFFRGTTCVEQGADPPEDWTKTNDACELWRPKRSLILW